MFNLEWLKNLIKHEPEPSLDARISFQVQAMHDIAMGNLHTLARGHNDRLKILEARSESVDAFYVKTVTQALSERQDMLINKVWNQWADDSKTISTRMEHLNSDTNNRIDLLIAKVEAIAEALRAEADRNGRTDLRIDALVSKLRAGLE